MSKLWWLMVSFLNVPESDLKELLYIMTNIVERDVIWNTT